MNKEDLLTNETLLTVIITYYKTLDYTKRLLETLCPQLNDKIEVIVVDDGCNEKELDNYNVKVIHLEKNSGTPSIPRNIGLDNAKGKYIVFIDGDDNITNDYVSTLLNDIQEDCDYYVYRWYANDTDCWGIWHQENMFYNWNVWSYMYKKEIIGNNRFDETMVAGEDIEWLKRTLKPEHKRKERKKAIYRYNTENEDSISHLIAKGLIRLRIEK